MQVKIVYCEIQSDHIFAVPEAFRDEVVDVDSYEDLDKYVTSKKDGWGNYYKRSTPAVSGSRSGGFRYISRAGGVKIQSYRPREVKKIGG